MTTQKKYRLIDLFSGAGGLSLGFVDKRFCGAFECVLALDNDLSSLTTHQQNMRGQIVAGDIEAWLKLDEVPAADVVIGGPPCQGFSLLNKQRKGDRRRELWEPFMDVVKKSAAKMFVMENVAELYRSIELVRIRRRAKSLGFETVAGVLNSADYGAPQTRKRTIIIGWIPGVTTSPAFPPRQTNASPDTPSSLPPWRTVRDAISDLGAPIGTELGDAPPMNLHFGRNPTEKSLKRYKAVPPGGNRFDLQRNAPKLTPGCWKRKVSGGTDLFGRLWWDRPSVTIRTEFFKPEKGRYLHPAQHRPITHREAARLMGFPDDFIFHGTKVEIARQIGNAVPPRLAEAVARVIANSLARKEHELVLQESRPRYAKALQSA